MCPAITFVHHSVKYNSRHFLVKFSFYFPLARFWQMILGGALAYSKTTNVNLPSVKSNILSFTGLFWA